MSLYYIFHGIICLLCLKKYNINNNYDIISLSTMLGLIGLGDEEVMGETVSALHAFDIPLVLASPRLAEMVTPKGNILTTAPDISSIVKVFHADS